MRVLITTDTVGGVWTFSQELARGLLERDCSVLLVSFGRAPSAGQQRECDWLARRFAKTFCYVASAAPLEWMDDNADAFARGAELLEREAHAFAPDVLHSNQFCYGALEVDVPRVVTAHSDVLSWAKACRTEPLEQTRWLDHYIAQVQAGLCGADAVAAPTHWMMSALQEGFALPERRVVVANGSAVPPSFRRPRMLRAVAAGRLWDEAKGISILEHVRSSIPVAVAGEARFEGAEGAQSLGTVQLLGQLSQLEMLELFRDSSIYLCTSVYEPFGLAALEAARCGCAVVARNIASLMEVWEDGALYFDNGESLSILLERLASDHELLARARRRSFERAQSFSRDRMVDGYLNLYEQVQAHSAKVEHAA